MTPEGSRLGHVPMLDGVRGLAIALVVLHHSTLMTSGAGGSVGVALFFVLSGFLITTILIENQVSTRRALARFYYRRAMRLLPAFMAVAVVSAILLALLGRVDEGLRTSAIAATYLANWPMAFGDWLGPMSHAWSLAIEEQFYLLWPLALIVGWPLVRRFGASPLFAGALLIGLVRLFLWNSYHLTDRLAFGTDTQADGLLLGAGIAVLRLQRTVNLPWLSAPIAIAALVVVAWLIPLGDGYFAIGQPIAIGASGALILASLNNTDRLSATLLSARPVRMLGLISYSVYLWHYPLMWYLGVIDGHSGWLLAVTSVVISLATASVSYVLIERPAMRSRDQWPKRAAPGGPRQADETNAEPVAAGAFEGTSVALDR